MLTSGTVQALQAHFKLLKDLSEILQRANPSRVDKLILNNYNSELDWESIRSSPGDGLCTSN